MSDFRSKLSRFSAQLGQLLLVGVGVLLTVIYLIQFSDPPFPAVVPVAFWFFYISFFCLMWVLRTLSLGPALWQRSIATGLAAVLTLIIYLAGHIGEQQLQQDLQYRSLSE